MKPIVYRCPDNLILSDNTDSVDLQPLLDDIRRHGLEHPIVIDDNQVLDGNRRVRCVLLLMDTDTLCIDGLRLVPARELYAMIPCIDLSARKLPQPKLQLERN